MAHNQRNRRKRAAHQKRLIRGQVAITHGVLVALRVHLRAAGFQEDSVEQIMLYSACLDLELVLNPGVLDE